MKQFIAETLSLILILFCSVVYSDEILNTGILVLPHVYNSEMMAPYDVFHHTKFHGKKYMQVFTISSDGNTITTFEGLHIQPDYSVQNAPRIDVLVIPSAEHNMDSDLQNESLRNWIRKTAGSAKFVVTLCDGAFMLANTGLLDNRNATTFPTDVAAFRKKFPAVKTMEGYSFVQDGKFLTSQGGAKSYDVAMYLIDQLYGQDAAKGVAAGLILPWPNPELKKFIAETRR